MRILMLCLGHLSLLVGLVGVPLPLLPTTPFLLLAAYCYSKGSKRFHDWLVNHPRLGPPIRDWWGHGVIRPRAKLLATVLILLSLSYPLFFQEFHWGLKLIAASVGAMVLAFIHSRPSGPTRVWGSPGGTERVLCETCSPDG